MEQVSGQERKSRNTAAEELSDNIETIEKTASVVVKGEREAVYCLSVIGQIEGHYLLPEGQKATKYEQLIPLLVSVEEDERMDGLLVVLNTMGGDVEAGLALAELIASMRKPTVTLVLGGGHSIGVPLAVAGRKSFIVPSATMTIHPVRMSGTVIAAPETYRYFERIRERIIKFVAAHSHISEDRFRQLMLSSGDMANDVGSVLYGEEAVTMGIIDRVGSLSDALDSLYRHSEYTIFAVVNMKVGDWEPSRTTFSGDAAFMAFVNRAKSESLYDTGVEVGADNHILTLITCDRSYAGKEGRLVILAVER